MEEGDTEAGGTEAARRRAARRRAASGHKKNRTAVPAWYIPSGIHFRQGLPVYLPSSCFTSAATVAPL